ncbi:hypothetical protein P8H26_08700 [Pseudochrobactrum sp. sp1633]|uniref:hypothetical protein n=1 Tax=Pseudochrobactrum sp. sp1633 TaxID=3036706 RepID=UPI0025A55EEE|nr:hypothetical protein [Pseudochrobactrum sp. sp1633]MDM8345472.1 hypothetical protein [Pseudochrobactrum sp. sp1633]HWD13100.1 hypothetical protein [Pseudochrobactrum sp.]
MSQYLNIYLYDNKAISQFQLAIDYIGDGNNLLLMEYQAEAVSPFYPDATDKGQYFVVDSFPDWTAVTNGQRVNIPEFPIYNPWSGGFLNTTGQQTDDVTNANGTIVGSSTFLSPNSVDKFNVFAVNSFGTCYIYKIIKSPNATGTGTTDTKYYLAYDAVNHTICYYPTTTPDNTGDQYFVEWRIEKIDTTDIPSA